MTTPADPPEYQDAQLTPEEEQDLEAAHLAGWLALLAHVREQVAAYYAAGLVAGDLGHDGTVRWEAQA